MRDKSCIRCSRSLGCTDVCVIDEQAKHKPMMILLDYPEDNGSFLTGKNTSLFDLLLLEDDVNIDKEIHVSYAVKCAGNGDKPDLLAMQACFDYVRNEVDTIKPNAILVCGEVAARSLLGDVFDYYKNIGEVVFTKNLGESFNHTPIVIWYDTEFIQFVSNRQGEYYAAVYQRAYDIVVKCHNLASKKSFTGTTSSGSNYCVMRSIADVKQLIGYIKLKKFAGFDFETPDLNYNSGGKPTSLAISFQAYSGYFLPMWHYSREYSTDEKEDLSTLLSLDVITRGQLEKLLTIISRKIGANVDVTNIYDYLFVMFEQTGEDGVDSVKLAESIKSTLFNNINTVEWSDEFIIEAISLLDTEVFGNPDIRKAAHNAKFDIHWGKIAGIKNWHGRIDDTALMHFAIANNRSHKLKEIISPYYPEDAGYEDDRSKYPWTATPFNVQVLYNCTDADVTARMCVILEAELIEDARAYIFYRNLFSPAMKSLESIEHEGVYVDRKLLIDYISKTTNIIEDLINDLRSYPEVVSYEAWKTAGEKKKAIEVLENKIYETQGKEADKVVAKIDKLQAVIKDCQDALEDDPPEKSKKSLYKKIEKARMTIADLKGSGDDSKHIKNWKEQISRIKTGVDRVYTGVNFGSPLQLGDLIYSPQGFGYEMQYDWKKREKTKTTDRKILATLDDDTGFITSLLRLKSVQHTQSTYLVGILERLDADGMLHTSYNQLIETGRISSRDPNLQNIPPEGRLKDKVAGEVTGFIKRSFTVEDGVTLIEADYSQAELRLVAFYAREESMLTSYAKGEDLHVKTGCRIKNITLDQYNVLEKDKQKAIRQNAKAANFGLIYGQGENGYMVYAKDNFGVVIQKSEAKRQRNLFFDMYPELVTYHASAIADCEEDGFIRTLFGYRRFLPDITSDDNFIKGEADRQAINTPIQGTAGQLTLFAINMLRLRLDPRIRIVNTVHDSILLKIPNELLDQAKIVVRDTMENLPLKQFFNVDIDSVKMLIDLKSSTESWGALKEI
jgi:uracil-DNA glycosylase family 4